MFSIDKKREPDWAKWKKFDQIVLWKAVALCCRDEPDDYVGYYPNIDRTITGITRTGYGYQQNCSDKARNLLAVAISHLGKKLHCDKIIDENKHDSIISLPDLVLWVLHTAQDHEMPRELYESALTETDKRKTSLTKENLSLMKLVIGMATGKYGYDPEKAVGKRDTTVSKIENDLAISGVELSSDAIRKHLENASKLVSDKKS